MRHVFVLEGTAPKPAASSFTCWERRRPFLLCSSPFFKPSSANSCFPHNHTQLLGFPSGTTIKGTTGPSSRLQSSEWTPTVLCHRQPGHLSGSDLPPGDGPLGHLAGRGLGVGLMELRREVGGRQATPRPEPGAGHSAHASSERRGLGYAMRRERPVRAAVPRDVSVATEMTSDPGASLGGGGLGGRRGRCYGNHVAGSGGAGGTGRAGQTGRLTPAPGGRLPRARARAPREPEDGGGVWSRRTGGRLHPRRGWTAGRS